MVRSDPGDLARSCLVLRTADKMSHTRGLSGADLAPREEEEKKRRPPFPQGMPLFICPPIGLPQQVSVKAQLHVGLRDSEAYKCMTGSSAPAGAGLSLGFKLLRLPLPQPGPFPRCQGPSVAPLNEGTAGAIALKLCPFQILIRRLRTNP